MAARAITRFFTAAVCVLAVVVSWPVRAADEPAWNPQKTWVMIVGVLEWQQSGLFHGFPKAGRRDAQLADEFRRRGVPSERVVFLEDRQATRDRIRTTLDNLLPQTNPGDLLVWYYAGHGLRSADKTYLANYDITANTSATGLSVHSVVEAIDQKFRGSRVLLAADCCHSGALGIEAARHRGPTTYAALTSTQLNSLSTGHWTFTECLLAGLSGDSAIDLDADGTVTLQELSRYTEDEMAFT